MECAYCYRNRETLEVTAIFKHNGNEFTEVYHRVHAGVHFPDRQFDGAVVVAGQRKDGFVRILAETSSPVVHELAKGIAGMWRFGLGTVFIEKTEENEARLPRFQELVLNAMKETADDHAPAFEIVRGYAAGGDELAAHIAIRRILVPANLRVAEQLQAGWSANPDSLNCLAALKLVLYGFAAHPYREGELGAWEPDLEPRY